MLHGNRPLLIPPVGLRHHAAVDHGEPIVTPEVDVDRGPVAVVANLFGIEHQRTVGSGVRDVGLQSDFRDGLAISVGELFAEFVDVSVVVTGEHFAECGESCSHRNWIRVVGAAVEDLVLRDKVHHSFAGAECGEGQASSDRLGEADHVGLNVEIF